MKEGAGAMDVRVRFSGDDAQALLAELRAWLTREDVLRGRVSAGQPVISPGQMGALAEVLIVALGAHGGGTALATSLAMWIRHRRPSAGIEVTGACGRRVKIAARDADIDVAALIRDITAERALSAVDGSPAEAAGRDPAAARARPGQRGCGCGDASA